MKKIFDLSECSWTVAGTVPYAWKLRTSMELGIGLTAEISAVPATVPGSVQKALYAAGIIPDWNYGLNCRACEWIENRQWIFETVLLNGLAEPGHRYVLHCMGLDHAGLVLVNGREAGSFESAFFPYRFDITEHLNFAGENRIQILFDVPPRYQGQMGYTSKCTAQKPRFYYGWDWMPRMVQVGIWDKIFIEKSSAAVFESVSAYADASTLTVRGRISGEADLLRVTVYDGDETLIQKDISPGASFSETLLELHVEKWWPNGMGSQKLYTVSCELRDAAGRVLDCWSKRVGFRTVEWISCEGAPKDADPWICVVNGKPVFLQGVNWTPVLPNFADTVPEQYEHLIGLYREMGCNILRVWGGAALEKELFYDLCDEAGLLLWQEFPLSSSGTESIPPSDEYSLELFSKAARSYVERLQHHPSMMLWGGGNELSIYRGTKTPCDGTEPLLQMFRALVEELDPTRRFVTTSPSGPVFFAQEKNFGKGLHWDVHGPWKNHYDDLSGWEKYWATDDALLRSETGAAGCSPAELIRKYSGGLCPVPASNDNPLWRRTSWWTDGDVFLKNFGREPNSLEEFTDWSANYQSRQLSVAARRCKERFPRCGGFLVWMGHDAFPCSANTSIIDFDRNPKPAFFVLKEIFCAEQG